MVYNFDNAAQYDQYGANIYNINNTHNLSLQNNNIDTRDKDSYRVQFAETVRPNISAPLVPRTWDFQGTDSFQMDQSKPYDLSRVSGGNVFNMGAASWEQDKQASTQGPTPYRGNGSISNPPFQENPAVSLTTNGRITPLVNQGQAGNIQGAHQAGATLSDNSVTSVQNPQSSQGAAAPYLQQTHQSGYQIAAQIQMFSNAKMEAEKKVGGLSAQNQHLRTNNLQMYSANQQLQSYVRKQDEFTQRTWQNHQRLTDETRELKNSLKTQTDQCEMLGRSLREAHRLLNIALIGSQLDRDIIKANLDRRRTAAEPNPHAIAASNLLLNQRSPDPVRATAFVKPTIISSRSGLSIHQNARPATPAPHNPLGYFEPAYSGIIYPTPPNAEKSQIKTTFSAMSSVEAANPQDDIIDLTADEVEKPNLLIQIASNTTGTNEVPAADEHSRDHYVENNTSVLLGGPPKEPPWMHQQRVKAKEQSLNQIFAAEQSRMKMKRKAEAEERSSKKAKTQPAVEATKPVQEKPVKKAKAPAKSKASAKAKKQSAQPTVDTSFSDKEREEKEAREFAAEFEAELDAQQEQETREFVAELEAELDAQQEQETREFETEIEVEPEAGATADLNAELNKNKQYKPDTSIDPALLNLDHNLDLEYADKAAEMTFDRPSSPQDLLFDQPFEIDWLSSPAGSLFGDNGEMENSGI